MKDPDYIALDLCGYRYNKKYPPNKERFGESYGGIKTMQKKCCFMILPYSSMMLVSSIRESHTIC